MAGKEKVCLAYSGGLDTSCICEQSISSIFYDEMDVSVESPPWDRGAGELRHQQADTSLVAWLIEKGYSVICFMADVGQEEDFEAAKEKALKIGAEKCYVEDLRAEFISELCFPAIQANAVSTLTKLSWLNAKMASRSMKMSTSLERPSLAQSLLVAKSPLPRKKSAPLSAMAAQARAMIKSASSSPSTLSNPPSKSLHHGASRSSTKPSREETTCSTMPRR